MTGPALDELAGWSCDGRGRITGIEAVGGCYRVSALSRFLLPGLDSDFAARGDVLEIEVVPFLESHVCGLVNLTRRQAETADPWRAALCAALILALPAPSIILAGRWWTLFFSGFAAALFLYLLFKESAALRRSLFEDRAAFMLSAWSILKTRHTGLPPGVEIIEGPEPEWAELLDRAYAGALENHEVLEMGTLPVPDGKLLACEPFQIHDPRPCTIAVPPGTYPIFISIAAAPEGTDQRIGYAWVRLREGAPERWEPARTRRGEEVSVGVDSGIACFTSAAAAARLVVEYDPGDRWGYGEPLSEALVAAMDRVWRDTRGWAVIEAEGGGRLAAFSSGFGDGVYPVYRALDSRRRRLAVAIVFFVDW